MDQVLIFIAKAQAILSTLSPVAISMVAAAIEMGLRFVKSPKPLSFLYLAGAMLKKAGAICVSIGGLFTKAGELSDKVLPQKLSEAPQEPKQ